MIVRPPSPTVLFISLFILSFISASQLSIPLFK